MSLIIICRLKETSPSLSRITSPTSEYENDKSDFECGNTSPKHDDEQGEISQKRVIAKKEITRSKTETSIDMEHVTSPTARYSTGGILSDGHGGSAKQNMFSFSPKKKRSSGQYPPIPPKPTVAKNSTSSASPEPSRNSAKKPLVGSLSPRSNAKSPPLDSPRRSPSHSPQRGSHSRSNTLKKQHSPDDDGRFANRCATMGSQQAFHEHHMNKKRRRKSSEKGARRFTATDSGKGTRVRSSLINNKFGYQFSPDMEERLQQKIEQGIENTYGSIDMCIHAAITIQRYYRQQKMVQRFKTLRKEVTVSALQPSRPRAVSMRLPTRAYSIKYKSRPEVKVSILDEFPEYRSLTNRIASRNKLVPPSLQSSGDGKDLGPNVRWRREASFEMQETVLEINDKSVTPERALSVTDDTGKDNDVFSPSPTPSPETYSPSPDSDPGQSIKRKSSGVPTSLSVDFLTSGHEEEDQLPRPHSISIMSHITRSKSMEELLIMDNKTGKPKKPQLKQQESATSLKKKTNIGITLFNRSVDLSLNTRTSHLCYCDG